MPRLRPLFLVPLALLPLCLSGQQEASYQRLRPVATFSCDGLSRVVGAVESGLRGLGTGATGSSATEAFLARRLLVPSLRGIDRNRPASLHYLAPPAGGDAPPIPAVAAPLSIGGRWQFMDNLDRAYAERMGENLIVFSAPTHTNSPSPLYVAIAENHALLSTSLDGVRWLAWHRMRGTEPVAPAWRSAALRARLDGPLAGAVLRRSATADGPVTNPIPRLDNLELHVLQAGNFLSAFPQVDLAADADVTAWRFSFRVHTPPGAPLSQALARHGTPSDSWMRLFPPSAGNRSVSALPAFVRHLPAEIRVWLAGLAQNTRLAGFHVLPGFPEADSALLPLLEGTGVSSYVADKNEGRIGAFSVFPLANTNLAEAALAALPGSFRKHDGTTILAYRPGLDRSKGETAGFSETLEAITLTLDTEVVEAAVSRGKLVVTRGRPGFINPWLQDKSFMPWKASVGDLSFHMPALESGETSLGGGMFEPSALFPRILAFMPEATALQRKVPHAGGGFSWRMSRSQDAASFDLVLTDSELAALLAMEDFQRRSMPDFIAQLVLRRTTQQQERSQSREPPKPIVPQPAAVAPPPSDTAEEPEIPELPLP